MLELKLVYVSKKGPDTEELEIYTALYHEHIHLAFYVTNIKIVQKMGDPAKWKVDIKINRELPFHLVVWGPFHWNGLAVIPAWKSITYIIKFSVKLLIHCQISMLQNFKFTNGWIISSHTLPSTWLLIPMGLKINHVSKRGHWWYISAFTCVATRQLIPVSNGCIMRSNAG